MKPCVIVVDDDRTIASLICDHLEQQGFRMTYCNDARQALIQAEGLRNVALMILDIMMPSFGSGIDVYKEIRNHPHFPKDLPVLFLTGLKPEAVKHLVPGNDPRVRVLHKPTTIQQLLQAMKELLGERWSDVQQPPKPR